VTETKPPEEKAGFPPRVNLHVDGKQRVVNVSLMRPIIDLQPITFNVSFAAFKKVTATILSAEADAEMHAAKSRPQIVKS
jgi:hypothetical protein